MRREFPKSVKIAAFQRCKGVCECGCGVKIRPGDGPEYHHRMEDALGGEPTLENCVVLRTRCHRDISGARRPELDKVRRGYEKRIGARESSGGLKKKPGTKFNWRKGRYERSPSQDGGR